MNNASISPVSVGTILFGVAQLFKRIRRNSSYNALSADSNRKRWRSHAPQLMKKSRNPDELKFELNSIVVTLDPAKIPELRSEAQKTVTSQIETINDIDTKASQILRLNILLIGVIVSVLSLAAQSGGDGTLYVNGSEAFINTYMGLGFASLILSTAFAAMTYGASELDTGIDVQNIEHFLTVDFSAEEVEELLLKNYIARINFNRSTNIRNLPLITATLNLVIAGVVFFSLGIYEAIIGTVPRWLHYSALLLFLVVVWRSAFLVQTYRAVRDILIWWQPLAQARAWLIQVCTRFEFIDRTK